MYLYYRTMSRINDIRFQTKYKFKWPHVMIQVFKNTGPFTEDAVSTKNSILFFQVEDNVVRRMTRSMMHPVTYCN